MRRASAGLLLASVLILPAPARADPAAPVRTGDHPGYGRVVFDLPPGVEWQFEREGDRLLVRFSGADPVVGGARPPRNVRGIVAAPGQAELTLAPGAPFRPVRLGNRLVLDILDPGAAPPLSPAPVPAPVPAPAAAAVSAAVSGAVPPPSPVAPPAAPAAISPAVPPPAPAAALAGQPESANPIEAAPVGAAARPAAPTATSPAVPPPAAPSQAAPVGPVALAATEHINGTVLLPFAQETAAAVFRRGNQAVLVFDERRPLDLATLRGNALFAAAEVRLLAQATMLTVPLPADRTLQLARVPDGWTVRAREDDTAAPIRAVFQAGPDGARLRLPAAAPGHSVAVPDPVSGGMLLVGTLHAPGQGLAVTRRTPGFALLPTWQGVAVAAFSDSLVLREEPDGFSLTSEFPDDGLLLGPADADPGAVADAAGLTRQFDFPLLPLPALLSRLRNAEVAAAAVPAGSRAVRRIAVAEAMLALGLGAEAQAVLSVAAEDPRAADDADLIGLGGIAALLAGRPAESGGLDDPRLSGTDEVALWRALRQASLHPNSPQAAGVLASEIRLLLAYPAALQDRMLPVAAETMVRGGATAAAEALAESLPEDHRLDFARALLVEPQDRAKALALLDQLAQSPDRLLRARAAPRALAVRLAAGELTVAQAADAMDRLLLSWRGDARESALRLRAAEWRAAAGMPRLALALLREGADALPEQAGELRPHMQAIFAAALAEDPLHPLPPLELVALAEDNPDLLPDGPAGLALAGRLADRLAALDLPRRAAPILDKLVAAAPPGAVRAELGGRLAATRLLTGDAAGALSALGATAADPLPATVVESRVLVWARATAAQGEAARAAAALTPLESPEALELRGQLLEQTRNWPAATAVLGRYVARALPAEGPLNEAQGPALLRLAADAAQAGDTEVLQRLRNAALPRLPPGPSADMLRLLTAPPVRLPEDLPRARREAALAAQLAGAMLH